MKSDLQNSLPYKLKESLSQLGKDLSLARRKRRLSIAMMVERIGVSKNTYSRAEKGDPSVSMGVYAMALYVLGLGVPFMDLISSKKDENGLLLEDQRIPKRIRNSKGPKT